MAHQVKNFQQSHGDLCCPQYLTNHLVYPYFVFPHHVGQDIV